MRASAVIIPATCFVIGTACGIFFSSKDDVDGTGGSNRGEAKKTNFLGSSLGSHSSGDQTETNRSTTSTSSPSSASLEQLLEVTSGGYSARNVADLYRLTESLDEAALLQLAEEIEQFPPNDNRAYQLRGALFSSLARKNPEVALATASAISNRNSRQNSLTAVITEIAQADINKAIDALDSIKDKATLRQVAQSFASSGSGGSPAALHQYLKEHPDLDLQWSYNQLYLHWAREDLPTVLANFGDITSQQQRNYALQGIGQTITEENLDEGLAFLETLSGTDKVTLLGSILGNLPTSDPSKALELLDTHAKGNQRTQLVSSIASSWMNSDPKAAKSWVESLENTRDRLAALQHLVWNDNGQSKWLAAQLDNFPATQQTRHLTSSLVQRWSQSDPDAAAEWVSQLPAGATRDNAFQHVTQQLASKDPVAAGEFLLNSLDDEPISRGQANSAGHIASEMARTDPQAAAAWMDSLNAGPQSRSIILSQMVGQWAFRDPDAAATYVMQLEGKDQQQGVSTLMNNWSGSDFDRAEAFASQLSDPQLRRSATNALISGSAYNDPARAAEALKAATSGLEQAEVTKHFSSAITNIANGWAHSDPVAAATWAVELPEGDSRPQALQSIVGQWAQFEPKAASEWLTTFEPGPDRDSAVVGLVTRITSDDPESAFAWAASIQDKSKRNNAVRQAINTWQQTDQNAARDAIESSDLSEKFRNQLLQSLPKSASLPEPYPGAEDDPFGF